jgi:hypothetical protein
MSQSLGVQEHAFYASVPNSDEPVAVQTSNRRLCLACKAMFGVELIFDGPEEFQRHSDNFR